MLLVFVFIVAFVVVGVVDVVVVVGVVAIVGVVAAVVNVVIIGCCCRRSCCCCFYTPIELTCKIRSRCIFVRECETRIWIRGGNLGKEQRLSSLYIP